MYNGTGSFYFVPYHSAVTDPTTITSSYYCSLVSRQLWPSQNVGVRASLLNCRPTARSWEDTLTFKHHVSRAPLFINGVTSQGRIFFRQITLVELSSSTSNNSYIKAIMKSNKRRRSSENLPILCRISIQYKLCTKSQIIRVDELLLRRHSSW